MAAVTVGASATVTGGTSLNVPIPAGGLVAVFVSMSANLLTTPSGWSATSALTSNEGRFMKELWANDPGSSVTLSFTGSVDAHAVAVCIATTDTGKLDEFQINSPTRNIGGSTLSSGVVFVWPVWYTAGAVLTTTLVADDRYDRQPSGFDSLSVFVNEGPGTIPSTSWSVNTGRIHYFFGTAFEVEVAGGWTVGRVAWGSRGAWH